MAITVRPLTVADVASVAQLFSTHLIETLHTRDKSAGVCGVLLSTAHDSKIAQTLYEKLGYTTDTKFRVFVRHLPS
jgi:hypothetical protein